MKSSDSRRIACCLLLASLAAPAVLADTLMVFREGSGTSDDGGAKIHSWSGNDRTARIDDNDKMIADLSAGMLYIVNDQTMTCHASSTRDTDRDPAALQAAVEAVKFRKTGKSERIGPWQAEIYELVDESGSDGYQIVLWISDEIPVDPIHRAYMESVVTPETAAMLAIYDLGGFPVRSEAQVGPIQMWSELESIEDKPAPAGTYDIPTGYAGCE